MNESLPSDLSDASLRQAMPDVVAREHRSVSAVVAHLAEFERRRLHVADGYPTLYAYAVEALGYSEDAAWRRVKAAEMVREYPAMLPMLADGRLHLTAVLMLTAHLTRANADDLLARVARKGRKAIERVLAERFPKADLPPRLAPIASAPETLCTVAPARNEANDDTTRDGDSAAVTLCTVAPARNDAHIRPAKLVMRAPERFGLQVTIDQTTHDLLRRAQDLLSHSIPNGELGTVLRHVLEAALPQLEKRKFGTSRPARSPSGAHGRHIPAQVKNAVWKRDLGRCTFVAEHGHRCESRKFLEFDHEVPFARGGEATIANLRLRCRAHNQYEAERAFGAPFMERKREPSRTGMDGSRLCVSLRKMESECRLTARPAVPRPAAPGRRRG
jgi:5-methylcytosine-specific restriction endonuclease McrA